MRIGDRYKQGEREGRERGLLYLGLGEGQPARAQSHRVHHMLKRIVI